MASTQMKTLTVGDKTYTIPSKTSELTNDSDYQTASDVSATVSAAFSGEAGVYGFVEHMDILAPGERIEYVGKNANYTAMTMDLTERTTNYGSWANFPSLAQNKPYMVKSTGEADYELSETDYDKKADGTTDSDVANLDYDGGAFSYFPKVYVKRWVDGTDRHVRFSYTKLPGYVAAGFIDTDGTEMDYVWLPMFYGYTDTNGKMRSISGTQPDMNQNTDKQHTVIKAFSDRAEFFAGPIIETIRDMLYMWFKTTQLECCGKGNYSGYDSANTTTYGVLANAATSGGQFYGSSDGKSFNKILHSVVLGTYQQWQRDPYYLVVNGVYKVSTNYTYDVTGATYIDTGIESPTVEKDGWIHPNLNAVIDGFGSVPIDPVSGSSSTGYCDGAYCPSNKSGVKVVQRFGNCGNWSSDGPGAVHLGRSAGYAAWDVSASVLLKSPVAASAAS